MARSQPVNLPSVRPLMNHMVKDQCRWQGTSSHLYMAPSYLNSQHQSMASETYWMRMKHSSLKAYVLALSWHPQISILPLFNRTTTNQQSKDDVKQTYLEEITESNNKKTIIVMMLLIAHLSILRVFQSEIIPAIPFFQGGASLCLLYNFAF